jgi:apolipoprotein N-acyltransferase
MRSVENRMPAARAANGGYSFLIDPVGRVVSEIAPPEGGAVMARLPVLRRRTLFSRTGDWIGPGALAVCLLLLGFHKRMGRRRGAGT